MENSDRSRGRDVVAQSDLPHRVLKTWPRPWIIADLLNYSGFTLDTRVDCKAKVVAQ